MMSGLVVERVCREIFRGRAAHLRYATVAVVMISVHSPGTLYSSLAYTDE